MDDYFDYIQAIVSEVGIAKEAILLSKYNAKYMEQSSWKFATPGAHFVLFNTQPYKVITDGNFRIVGVVYWFGLPYCDAYVNTRYRHRVRGVLLNGELLSGAVATDIELYKPSKAVEDIQLLKIAKSHKRILHGYALNYSPQKMQYDRI